MYHEDTDTPAVARTSNLNEELGQVGYLLRYGSWIWHWRCQTWDYLTIHLHVLAKWPVISSFFSIISVNPLCPVWASQFICWFWHYIIIAYFLTYLICYFVAGIGVDQTSQLIMTADFSTSLYTTWT